MKKSLLRVATLESGIITTTPATRAFFDANPEFHVNILKDKDGKYYASFISVSTGERLRTSHLTNDIDELRQAWHGRYVRLTTSHSVINLWFDRTKAEEMEYVNRWEAENNKKVLCEGTYKGYDYKIVSYGTHPCAYIALSGKIADLKDPDDFPAWVHGGPTFLDKLDGIDKNDPKTYVGWDYSHCDDFTGDFLFSEDPYYKNLKKWTTEEILAEVFDAIDQLQ